MSRDEALEVRDWEGAFALLAAMAQDFAASLDLEATVQRALASMVEHVGAEAGSFWLLDEAGEELTCLASVGPNPITGLRLPVSEGIVGRAVRQCACQQVLDTAREPDFSALADARSGAHTRSLICSPLPFAEEALGAVELINKRGGDGCFDEADAQLLRILASSAGLAIANSRLAEAQAETQRVQREVELAAEIQRSLLPAPQPGSPVVGVNRPARTVSGDFYDVLTLADGRIAFCLGDVAGKAINAALLMAKSASLFRALAKDVAAPGALLARLNDELCETSTRGMFVTMVAGVYDPPTGRVVLANAGHEPPLLRDRAGGTRALPAEAPPVGILPGTEYPETELALEGGALYVCSDGLTEACMDGRELGSAGFLRLVERYAGKPVAERVEAIAAEAFGYELRDDVTLLVVSDEAR